MPSKIDLASLNWIETRTGGWKSPPRTTTHGGGRRVVYLITKKLFYLAINILAYLGCFTELEDQYHSKCLKYFNLLLMTIFLAYKKLYYSDLKIIV